MVGGEISPTALGRVDQNFYFKSLQKARNVYISPQGYVKRREGQRKINETVSSGEARNIEFAFNTEQEYRLEFSAGRFDVYKDDVHQATVTTALIAALTMDDIKNIGFTQSADTLILTRKNVKPIRITRTSDTAWVVDNAPLENIPVYPYNGVTESEPAYTLTPSGTSGDITLTTSSSFWVAATHEKQYVIINNGLVFIKTVTSGTVAEGLVISELSSSSAATSGNWTLETGYEDVWSTSRGWPDRVSFFRGRLYLAGGARPQTVWASKANDFFNMDQGSGLDDEGFEFDLNDDGVNAILNLFGGRTLQIFTSGGEFFIRSSTTKPITPTNIVDLVERATGHGSESARPISIDGATVFIERDGAVVRDYLYNDVEQSYSSNILSELSDHLIVTPTDIGVRKARPGSPTDHVFFVNSNGTLAVLNLRRQQEFIAWSLFETEGEYEDVCVVDKDVYVIVKREINGVTKRFTEKLEDDYLTDCSIKKEADPATDSWSGLGHLDGEEIKVIGDGYVLDDATPASGAITSSEEVESLEVGFGFYVTIQPLPLDAVIGGNALTGDYRRVCFVNLLLHESREIVVKNGTRTYRPAFRGFGDNVLDQPVKKYTGWKRVNLGGLISDDPAPVITQEQPVNFQLLSMTMGVV